MYTQVQFSLRPDDSLVGGVMPGNFVVDIIFPFAFDYTRFSVICQSCWVGKMTFENNFTYLQRRAAPPLDLTRRQHLILCPDPYGIGRARGVRRHQETKVLL
jgi:hypothetical protein